MKAAAQDNSIDDIINDIKSAQKFLVISTVNLVGTKSSNANDLKLAFATISSAAFARFGNKSAVSKTSSSRYTETSRFTEEC